MGLASELMKAVGQIECLSRQYVGVTRLAAD